MKKIGFLTIITAALFFSACNPDTPSVNDDDQNIPTEAGFSVSPDKRVDFAKGNLLFHRYPGTLLVDSVYIKTTGSGKNKKYYVDSVKNIDKWAVEFPNLHIRVDSAKVDKTGWVDSVKVEIINPEDTQLVWVDDFEVDAIFEKLQFADNQLSYLGITFSSYEKDADEKWVDLFAWSSEKVHWGLSTSNVDSIYSGAFADWGASYVGDDEKNTWRTLTSDEWGYLRWSRPRAAKLCGAAQVAGVNGLVLLPDNWKNTPELTFVPGFNGNYGAQYFAAHQEFTSEQWAAMEAAGAVFLPAVGYADSDMKTITNSTYFGRYWSATQGACLEFYSREAGRKANDLYRAISVRLVKDLNE